MKADRVRTARIPCRSAARLPRGVFALLAALLACSPRPPADAPPDARGGAAPPTPPPAVKAPPAGRSEPRPNPNEVKIPPEKLDVATGLRLTAGSGYDAQPAIVAAADGTATVAWVRWQPDGADEVLAQTGSGDSAGAPAALSPEPGQYMRPVLAAAGNDTWCFWTRTEPERVSTIWYSRRAKGVWSPAARLLPDESRAHLNPEVAGAADGRRLAVAYQIHTGAGYDIHLRTWNGASWDAPVAVSGDATNDWDPAVAFDRRGRVHVVWSGYADGDYDVYWTRLDSGPGTSDSATAAPRRLSARGEYDLHPSLAAAPDGTVWAAWDVVRIPGHGFSGYTTITGANLRAAGIPADDGYEVHQCRNHWAGLEVRVLDGDAVRVPGRPREELVAPRGYLIAHCGLPKIAVAPSGDPWVFYRALHRLSVPWSANARDGYLWEVMARPFRGGSWQPPVLFLESDGYLEEPGVAPAPSGIRVAWTSEHRRSTARGVSFHVKREGGLAAPGGAGEAYDHHRDFDGLLGWDGDVYAALIPAPSRAKDAKAAPASSAVRPDLPEAVDDDRAPMPRLPRGSNRYAVAAGGKTYRLLWGDTHRHSNVSRCTLGTEPSPDDLYRYGADIYRYDFFALSDHSEYTTDYYWWRQQKVADLHHVPGWMSVLYNSEWSMSFPHGHHNTVFPARPTVKLHGWLGDAKTLAGGWAILEAGGLRAITIPHTPADPGMGTAWEIQDDRYQRLCEIFQSGRGSYEHEGCPRQFHMAKNPKGFYWKALEKGWHVGVICSSDHGFGTAYACVYAPENSRESVWQALWDRRTYGSTTYGLVLDVRSGGHWMGEQWTAKEAPTLDVFVRGAAPIRSVEILGRSKVLYAEGSVEKPLDKPEVRLTWTDPEWAAQTKEQWYYVRVIQTDDEMAWSSPVWVTPTR